MKYEPGKQRAQVSKKQLTTFLAFWYAAAAVFLVLSIGTVAAVHNGHRLAAFLLLLGGGCFAAAQLVQRARRRFG
jgi:hypothetical protein